MVGNWRKRVKGSPRQIGKPFKLRGTIIEMPLTKEKFEQYTEWKEHKVFGKIGTESDLEHTHDWIRSRWLDERIKICRICGLEKSRIIKPRQKKEKAEPFQSWLDLTMRRRGKAFDYQDYKLTENTYKNETYEKPYKKGVTITIKMHYHTTRHYWHVAAYFKYYPNFRTDNVLAAPYIKTRKEAREIAQNYMDMNPSELWGKVSDFHKKHIEEQKEEMK